MRWCSVLSHATTADAAVAEVSERLDRILGGASPNVLWAFVSPAFESGYEVIHDALSEAFPSAVIVGCSGAGVLADGTEVERQAPALAAMAAVLPGVETTVRHFETSSFPEAEDAPGWHRLLGVEPSDSLAFILLPDPFTCDVEHLIAAMDHAYPDAPKVGGLVSGGSSPGEHVLYVGRARHNRGVTVVAMQGNLSVRSVVAQGCRPVGDPMLVTRCQDNVIFELNQKKPAEVLQALAEQLDASVFSRHGFFLGIEMRDQREYRPGDFLVRNLLGVDKSTGGLVVGASIKQFQAVQFHVFDRQAAAMDLSAQLEREASEHGSVAARFSFLAWGGGKACSTFRTTIRLKSGSISKRRLSPVSSATARSAPSGDGPSFTVTRAPWLFFGRRSMSSRRVGQRAAFATISPRASFAIIFPGGALFPLHAQR